jgi:uncharacterized membrane protein
MDKKKKITLIAVGVVEVAILIFCLVVSILVLSRFDPNATEAGRLKANGNFIGGLQNNPTLFFCTIALPVFIIFLVDAVYLIVYAVKKPSSLSDDERAAIEAKAKEEARKEIEAEMAAEKKPADPEQK